MTAQINGESTAFSEENLADFTSIPKLLTFTIRDFFKWWYIQMPVWQVKVLTRLIVVIDDQFSISLLIKNFSVPWHRDRSAVGYFIGIAMRILYLPLAISTLLLAIAGYLSFIIFWILIPIVTVIMIFISPFVTT
jgi:hypothetical protein